MKKIIGCLIILCVSVSVSMGAYVNDSFTGIDGTLLSTLDQWTTAGNSILSNNAAYLPSSSAATNTVSVSPTVAWTDFDIKPALGAEPTSPPTNSSSALFYFNANSNIVVWNDSAWSICSNDVWGNAVTAISADDYVRISIYQNYTDNEYSLFLDEKCLIQDVPFPKGSESVYTSFAVQNVDSNAVVDYVRIQATAHTANSNNNHNSTADITEMHSNGYVARTLYVPGTGNQPSFATLQAACTAARDGDQISVAAGSYAETVTIASEVTFIGGVFTTTTFTANSAVTFEENIETGTFTANADVTLSGGADLDATTLLDINSGALVTGTSGSTITTPDLDMIAGTEIDITSGILTGTGITLDGTFEIDGGNWNSWGGSGILAQSLPFTDNFDHYSDDTAITNYGLYGWGASAGTVKVQSSVAYSDQALILPDGTSASNTISDSATAVWTEYYLRPMVGAAPSSSNTTGKSFMSYVDTNGFMVVYDDRFAGGWSTCSNTLGTTPHTPGLLTTNGWRRIAIYQNFASDEAAVFVADAGGNLEIVKQQVNFPGGNLTAYNYFIIENNDNNAYLDNITISTATPTGGDDLDGDGILDTVEISMKGFINDGDGSVFLFM